MTLEEIRKSDSDFLTVQQVADCLHMAPQVIRDQAERDIKWLGFPICRAGHAFKIPRLGFLTWATGLTPTITYQDGINAAFGQKE